MDFAVSAAHEVKLKESEKRDKFQDLARELKKWWNIRMTVLPIVMCSLGTVTEGLVNELEN